MRTPPARARLHGLDHRVVRPHAREQAIHDVLGIGHPEPRRDEVAELLLLDLAGLDPAQVAAGLLVAEELDEGVGLEPLGAAEGAERLEHVRRQHAAEIDQQALHPDSATSLRLLGQRGHPLVEEPEVGVVG